LYKEGVPLNDFGSAPAGLIRTSLETSSGRLSVIYAAI
jgi:hypothetical protein